MARFLCAVLIGLCLLWPSSAFAADIKFNVSLTRQEDGTTLGEVLFNERVIWRLKVCSDGVEPVSSNSGTNTTVVIPDIVNGLFVLKMHNH
jgi:hypothetical protein